MILIFQILIITTNHDFLITNLLTEQKIKAIDPIIRRMNNKNKVLFSFNIDHDCLMQLNEKIIVNDFCKRFDDSKVEQAGRLSLKYFFLIDLNFLLELQFFVRKSSK